MTMPLLSIPSTIIGALCMVLVPRISSSYVNNAQETNEQINVYLKFTISCIFIFIPLFVCIGIPACEFVYSNSTAGLYLKYSCWTMIPLGLSQITTSILNALNQETKTFIYYIISSIFLILSVFILPKFLGILAMLFATGISSIVILLLNMYKLRKLLKIKTNILSLIISHSLITIPIILITTYSYNIFSHIFGSFITLIIVCVISVISFISLLFVFNILEFNKTKDMIIKFTKKTHGEIT